MTNKDAMKCECLLDWKPITDEIFVAQLEMTFKDVDVGDVKILCGDLSAKVDCNNTHWANEIGLTESVLSTTQDLFWT